MAAVSEEIVVAAVSGQAVAAVVVFAAAAAVAVVFAAAAAAVVVLAAAVSVVAFAAAAVSLIPSLLEPRFSLCRGPMSWPRDSNLGRMPIRWSWPTLRLQLRIPEPLELLKGSSAADSALWCHPAEAALES